jgi:hypothetical protein
LKLLIHTLDTSSFDQQRLEKLSKEQQELSEKALIKKKRQDEIELQKKEWVIRERSKKLGVDPYDTGYKTGVISII